MVVPLVTGVVCVCAEPGSLLTALEGDEEGSPAFPVAELVCICIGGFFILVAVPAGFEATIAAILVHHTTPRANLRLTAPFAVL